MKFKYRRSYNCIIAFLSVVAILMTACAVNDLAPFGVKTFAGKGEFDTIAYIKAVLEGKQNIFYSFSGSAGRGIFYRLSETALSPFNLFTALSSTEDFNSLYNLFLVIRVSLSAAACAAYINYRYFSEQPQKGDKQYLKNISCIAVSVLYALAGTVLSGGAVTAAGLVFLPLILLGVYKITIDKGAQMFIVSMLLNLLINWYSGLFNAAVAVLWFIFEIVMNITGSDGFVKQGDVKAVFARSMRFIISLGLALAASSVMWYSTFKLLPGKEAVSTATLTTDLPGIGVMILGGLSLIVYLVLSKCSYGSRITMFVFTAGITVLLMFPQVSSFLAGKGRMDTGIRPLRYILSFLMVFIFCQMFLSGNKFSKMAYVIETATVLAGVLLIVQLIAGIFVPMKNTFSDMTVSYDYDHQAYVTRTLVKAVRDLDKGTYRIGFVSDDIKSVSLLSSDDDYLYFDYEEDRIDPAGDIIGSLYPYGVKYLISHADLTAITGGNAPLGEFEGYSIYYNPYSAPLAFLYDGTYFDEEFRKSDAEQRLMLAASAREHIPAGLNVTSNDIKFTAKASAAGAKMFISVPTDPNMKMTLNKSAVSPSFYSGRFYSIDLAEGQNTVTLTYQAEFWDTVAIVSFAALLALVLFIFIENFYDMHYPH